MAKTKEIRITFKEKESDIYDYIQSKSSASAFLKDLAKLEMKREEIVLNNLNRFEATCSKEETEDIEDIIEKAVEETQDKVIDDDFNIDELDISDLID